MPVLSSTCRTQLHVKCSTSRSPNTIQIPLSFRDASFPVRRGYRLTGQQARLTHVVHSHAPSHASTWPCRDAAALWPRFVRAHAASETPFQVAEQNAASKIGVLFVCLGNICRSPTAEAMFRAVVERNGVTHLFHIDSCGTGGGNPEWYLEGGFSYHEGHESDPRMAATAKKRGVVLTSRSRPLLPLDLTRFDYIIGMDAKNMRAIQEAVGYWSSRLLTKAPEGESASAHDTLLKSKLSLMTDYCRKYKGSTHVPDPYYGGTEGFEKVLDLLDDACEGLLETIRDGRGL